MKTLRMNTTGKQFALVLGAALTLLSIDAIAPQLIRADVKIRARVRTPNVVIDVNNGGHHGPQVRQRRHNQRQYNQRQYNRNHRYRRWNRPIRPVITRHYVVNQNERKIAKRLSYMTGWETQTILRLKKEGYGWHAIANHLDFPNHFVAIAKDKYAFRRFKQNNRQAECVAVGYYDD